MTKNRRTRMTKRMIHDAFLQLLEERPITKITVTEICEKADVNRSTFYANYADTEQLLCEIENEVLEQIPVSSAFSSADYMDMLESFFEYVRQNERVFRVLLIQSDNGGFNQKLISGVMEKYHQSTWTAESLLSRYCYMYCVNGVIGLTKEWISGGFAVSTRKFSELVLQMSMQATENIML